MQGHYVPEFANTDTKQGLMDVLHVNVMIHALGSHVLMVKSALGLEKPTVLEICVRDTQCVSS